MGKRLLFLLGLVAGVTVSAIADEANHTNDVSKVEVEIERRFSVYRPQLYKRFQSDIVYTAQLFAQELQIQHVDECWIELKHLQDQLTPLSEKVILLSDDTVQCRHRLDLIGGILVLNAILLIGVIVSILRQKKQVSDGLQDPKVLETLFTIKRTMQTMQSKFEMFGQYTCDRLADICDNYCNTDES